MTWLTWRLQRLQILVAGGVVLAFAVWLFLTGEHAHAAFLAWTQHGCNYSSTPEPAICIATGGLEDRLNQANHWIPAERVFLYAIPAVLGVVLGAPLVAKEIEQGTNRLAWTQSITRIRWLTVKLVIPGLIVAVIVGSLIPLVAWWTGAAQLASDVNPTTFDVSGFVPLGYASFAFALGAALGAVIRRTGWAVAIALPVFALCRALVEFVLRPQLASPITATVAANNETIFQSSWVMSYGAAKSGGLLVRYQPESHFWALQGAETAVFVAAALLLLWITLLAVQKWRT